MKKQLVIMLVLSLTVASLSACGKNSDEQSITRIEASDAAESKEPTERKYKDNTNESVEAPNRNSTTNSNVDATTANEENTVIDRDPSIYGIWSSNDNTNLTIFNSSAGAKFIMYDAPNDRYITGDVTTDESTYIEMRYLKPVEQSEEQVADEQATDEQASEEGQVSEEQPEDESVNPYGSDEEFYAALEKEQEEQYETVRYTIDKNKFDQETATMSLVLSSSKGTLDLHMSITVDTPDYSTEDNEFASDMAVDDDTEETEEEAVETAE